MAIAPKLAPVRGKNESKRPVTEMRDLAKSAGRTPGGFPLTPELKEFIDHAIIPALVRQYLVEIDSASTPEKHIGASTGERQVGSR
jgi:hypothetical protein